MQSAAMGKGGPEEGRSRGPRASGAQESAPASNGRMRETQESAPVSGPRGEAREPSASAQGSGSRQRKDEAQHPSTEVASDVAEKKRSKKGSSGSDQGSQGMKRAAMESTVSAQDPSAHRKKRKKERKEPSPPRAPSTPKERSPPPEEEQDEFNDEGLDDFDDTDERGRALMRPVEGLEEEDDVEDAESEPGDGESVDLEGEDEDLNATQLDDEPAGGTANRTLGPGPHGMPPVRPTGQQYRPGQYEWRAEQTRMPRLEDLVPPFTLDEVSVRNGARWWRTFSDNVSFLMGDSEFNHGSYLRLLSRLSDEARQIFSDHMASTGNGRVGVRHPSLRSEAELKSEFFSCFFISDAEQPDLPTEPHVFDPTGKRTLVQLNSRVLTAFRKLGLDPSDGGAGGFQAMMRGSYLKLLPGDCRAWLTQQGITAEEGPSLTEVCRKARDFERAWLEQAGV